MKLAIIHADPAHKLSSRLTLFWTGSTAYHCGFVDESDGTFFDMNLTPRKVKWPRYDEPHKWVNLYDADRITRADCELYLRDDGAERYGVKDYLLFGLRPIYHLAGQSTPNAAGIICSELMQKWLHRVGYIIDMGEVMSPAALELWAVEWLRQPDREIKNA
jgi:hypothetical protein